MKEEKTEDHRKISELASSGHGVWPNLFQFLRLNHNVRTCNHILVG